MKAKPSKHAGEVVLELKPKDQELLAAAANKSPLPGFRVKKILVPIDFSDCSRKALRYAIPLASQNQATITLLYVVTRPNYIGTEYSGAMDYASYEIDLRKSGEADLKQWAEKEVPETVSVNTRVTTGPPAPHIVEFAKTLPADLIVISTHGRTGIKHMLLGSVAEHVVRSAPCPVLVVPEHEQA